MIRNLTRLFQIGEITKTCKITRRMLLNYEELGLITPTYVNPVSGYRYYDVFAIERIELIIDLKKTGLPLPKIADYLNGKTSTETQIFRLQQQQAHIAASIRDLKRRNRNPHELCVEKEHFPSMLCLCTDYMADNTDQAMALFYQAVTDFAELGIAFDQTNYNFFEYPVDIFSENFFELEDIHLRICLCIDEESLAKYLTNHSKDSLPGKLITYPECDSYLISICDSFENLPFAYLRLRDELKEKGITNVGYPREIYLEGNFDKSYNNYITEVVIPLLPETSDKPQ